MATSRPRRRRVVRRLVAQQVQEEPPSKLEPRVGHNTASTALSCPILIKRPSGLRRPARRIVSHRWPKLFPPATRRRMFAGSEAGSGLIRPALGELFFAPTLTFVALSCWHWLRVANNSPRAATCCADLPPRSRPDAAPVSTWGRCGRPRSRVANRWRPESGLQTISMSSFVCRKRRPSQQRRANKGAAALRSERRRPVGQLNRLLQFLSSPRRAHETNSSPHPAGVSAQPAVAVAQTAAGRSR